MDTIRKTTPLNLKKFRLRKFLIATSAILTIIIAIVSGFLFYIVHNPAEDATMSLQKELVKSGGVVACSYGFSGHGSSYPRPTYNATLQFDVGKEEATQAVLKAAKDSGFTPTPVDSDDPAVNRYGDSSSKQPSYPGLESGPIELSVVVKNGGKPYQCTSGQEVTSTLKSDETHTVVNIGVMLPYLGGKKIGSKGLFGGSHKQNI